MQKVVTRVLQTLTRKFGSVDEGAPLLIDWDQPVTPVVDVSRVAAAHSPLAFDGWLTTSMDASGNATGAVDIEVTNNVFSLLQSQTVRGQTIQINQESKVWLCAQYAQITDPGASATLIVFRTHVEDGRFFPIAGFVTTAATDAVPAGAATTEIPVAVAAFSSSTFPFQRATPYPIPFQPRESIRYVSLGIVTGVQMTVMSRWWISPDGTPPPGF